MSPSDSSDHIPAGALADMTVLTTGDLKSIESMVKFFSDAGANVISYPVIEAVKLQNNSELHASLKNLHLFEWIIFLSKNAVKFFFEELIECGYKTEILTDVKIAAAGTSTARLIENYSLSVELVPEKFVSENLFIALKKRESLKGKKILIPRSVIGRDVLIKALRSESAVVSDTPVYDIKTPDSSVNRRNEILDLFLRNSINWITFTSSSTVDNFFNLMGDDLKSVQQRKVKIASIGPITSETLKKHGISPDIEPDEHTSEALAAAIIERNNHE